MHIVPLSPAMSAPRCALCEAALERGVFAQAIRPPTVPAGTSRLRLAVMATHTAEELRDAARVLGAAARELGLDLARSAARRGGSGARARSRSWTAGFAEPFAPDAPPRDADERSVRRRARHRVHRAA